MVRSEEYGVIGRIEILSNNEMHVYFTYSGIDVEEITNVTVNDKTIEWLPSIAELVIDNYIREKEVEKKMQEIYEGGVPWK
jgi:hypothetical protein